MLFKFSLEDRDLTVRRILQCLIQYRALVCQYIHSMLSFCGVYVDVLALLVLFAYVDILKCNWLQTRALALCAVAVQTPELSDKYPSREVASFLAADCECCQGLC